ncbi:ESCRT-II complex, vps25 subunit [Daldinia vernicosa]|uniref:ESCRT-II complex, vps25 subunit n=1 Tax=Daldinia vernicosa TaxID=114800 RepID=UPI00200778BC|nr:ESCRT-II complex, vps25 subunit [Daldinia vernicosa]KAI0849832.1 ESCRT-II complex, vps25 subunit [Daldinia vernicosa]
MSSTPTPTTTTTAPTTAPPPPPPPPFDFPREYHFPPFFTRQTNLTTHHSQLEKWSSLILSYARQHRIFRLSLAYDGTPYEDLFRNRRLGRSLRLSDAREVLEFMRKEGRAEPVAAVGKDGSGSGSGNGGGGGGGGGGAGDVYWVYWRTPEEWAGLVEAWVDETAQKGAVLTLYELTDGEGTRGTEFYGLDPDLLQKALQVLVKRGKAQIFGQEDQQGVKFF